jgi:hypothetical protein
MARDFLPEDPNLGSETALADIAFSFTVLDVNGIPLTGFHYTSDSGHDYGLTGGIFVAPEPPDIGCALGGLVALILLGGKRLRSSLNVVSRTNRVIELMNIPSEGLGGATFGRFARSRAIFSFNTSCWENLAVVMEIGFWRSFR